MSPPLSILRRIQAAHPSEAWDVLLSEAWSLFSAPLSLERAAQEVVRRDREIASLDLILAGACWDLWPHYAESVEKTSDAVGNWWRDSTGGRAVLILDGLSLREVPWILNGVNARGYTLHRAGITAAELPSDTTPFAKALGFGQRSAIENNGALWGHRLPGARTDCVNLPWQECVGLIGSEPNWVLWHHWPDEKIHEFSEPGLGLAELAANAATHLTSASFWDLIQRLCTGRRLVITSDHGYAATGLFPDTADDAQAKHLKQTFSSGRTAPDNHEDSPWVPPIDVVLETKSGRQRFVLGRRKWKSQGGYPTLAHGGLSILEVAVPFIEISKLA